MSTNIRESVLAQVETKIAAGEELSRAIDHESQARAALDDATSAVTQARALALKAGWTESELRRLGLVPSARQSRTTRTRKPRTAGTQENDSTDVQDAHS